MSASAIDANGKAPTASGSPPWTATKVSICAPAPTTPHAEDDECASSSVTTQQPPNTKATMSDHLCASGGRCRDGQIDGNTRVGAIIAEQRGLCRRCYGSVRRAVESLETDWDRLSAAVGDQAATNREYVTGTPGSPMPLNGAVLALRSSLSEWCEAALWMVAETLGIDVRTRHKAKGWPVRELPVITQAARALPDNMKTLMAAPAQPVSLWDGIGNSWYITDMDGVDVAVKLANLHREVDLVLGETNPRKRLNMPCPVLDCGARGTLGIDNGTDQVNCTACGGSWSQAQYDWLANLLVSEHKKGESEMVKWLLLEAQWKLKQIERLAGMGETDLAGIDGFAVVELLRELLDSQKATT